MSRAKQYRTRLVRIGNSLGVRIPKEMVEQVRLSTRLLQAGELGPEVELTVEGDAIVIRPYSSAALTFQERAAPLLEQVSAVPPDAQELVLQAIAGTVDWLVRARQARERLVPILREVYSQHKPEIEALKQRGQEIWERDDLLWFLLLHRVLSTQADVVTDPSLSYNAVANLVVTTEDPADQIAKVLSVRGGAIIQVQERAEALVRCYERIAGAGGLEAQTVEFRALTSRWEMEQFLRQFETDPNGRYFGINGVYDPLEELYIPAFSKQLGIHGTMHTLLDKLHLSGLYLPQPQPLQSTSTASATATVGDKRQSAPELFYRQVAQQAGIEPWDLKQLTRRYYSEISRLLDEQPAAERTEREDQSAGSA